MHKDFVWAAIHEPRIKLYNKQDIYNINSSDTSGAVESYIMVRGGFPLGIIEICKYLRQ